MLFLLPVYWTKFKFTVGIFFARIVKVKLKKTRHAIVDDMGENQI